MKRERIEHPPDLPVDWEDRYPAFARHSSAGLIADPTAASAELGAELWRETVASAAQTIGDIGRTGFRKVADTTSVLSGFPRVLMRRPLRSGDA